LSVFSYKLFWLPDPQRPDYESVLRKRNSLSNGSRLTFDPHGNTKRKAPEIFRCFLCFCRWVLHGLCHEAAHPFCGLLLHPVGGVGIDTQGESCFVVAQHAGHCLYIDTVLERHSCEGVPKIMKSQMFQPCVLPIFRQHACGYCLRRLLCV